MRTPRTRSPGAHGDGRAAEIVRGMREHNGTEPDPVEEDERFTVRLWKASPASLPGSML